MSDEVTALAERLRQYSARFRAIEEESEKELAEHTGTEEAREALKGIYAATEQAWNSAIEFSRQVHGDTVVDAALEEFRKQQ